MPDAKPARYKGTALSRFRTYHECDFFEIKSPQAFSAAYAYAKKKGLPTFVLGNGSNIFFKRKNIRSLIIKNSLPKMIESLGEDKFKVSSSTELLELLNKMYAEGRDAPYYLASAPCQVGGALAMNAGTGPREGKSISDFLESVEYFDNGNFCFAEKSELYLAHRKSSLQKNGIFIVSAIFRFPKKLFSSNPVKERLSWAAKNQDLSLPNCGSLCTRYDARIMKFVRLLFAKFPAGISSKKLNWAYNKSPNPIWLRSMIFILAALHKMFRKELRFELKIID